jgi:MFS family permease
VISPASLAIIASSFAEGHERNRALGAWSAMAGLGVTSGVLLGGLLTDVFNWPAIFLINAPIAAAVVFFGLRLIAPDEASSSERDYDAAGAVTVTAGLTAVVFGIVRTDALGWSALGVWVPIGIGVAFLAAFVLIEARFATSPLMPLRIFSMPALRAANVVILLLGAALFAMWFFLSLFLQQVLGHSPLETGLDFLPMTLSIVAAATLAPRLVDRFGPKPVLTAGMLFAAAGLAILGQLSPDTGYVPVVLFGGIIAAIGLGTSMVPATIAAVTGVPRHETGLASGMVNTSRLVGGALGLAALSTIATSHANSEIASGTAALVAQTDGYQVALLSGSALCLLGALAAVLMLPRRSAAPAVAVAAEPS